MRILVLGINYAPERTSVAPFTTGLCEHLAEQGHEVSVVTAFPYYPEWRVWDGYRGWWYRRESIHGVTVRRVWHYVPRTPSKLLQRLAYDLSFTLTAFFAALFSGKCDVIYCSCPPPTLAAAAYLLGKMKGVPYVIKLTDLASDAALATGIVRSPVLIRVARGFEKLVYNRALAVICLCRAFVDKLLERNVPGEKLREIPDWGDTENIHPTPEDGNFRRVHGFSPHQFLVLHTGNIGKKQDLMNVVRAALLTKNEPDIVWAIVGEGEDRPLLERAIADCNLKNIALLPFEPAARLCQMYASADLLLLNQTAKMEDAVIPSKLLTYMAAGRAIVAAASERSEAARLVRYAGCGFVVPAGNPEALAGAVIALRRDFNSCRQFGANGRAFAESRFTKARVLTQYDEFFASIGFSAVRVGSIQQPIGISAGANLATQQASVASETDSADSKAIAAGR